MPDKPALDAYLATCQRVDVRTGDALALED
jgi:hypothetical protein